MSKVEAILSQLKDIAANPKKAMDDYKAETGKGAVGIMPIYAPEERFMQQATLPDGYLGRTGQNNFQSSYIIASFCLFHYAAGYGTAVRRCL